MIGRGPGATAVNTHRIETGRLHRGAHRRRPTLFDLVGGADRVEITEHLICDGPDRLSETREFIEEARTGSYGANGFHWGDPMTGMACSRLRRGPPWT